MRILFAGRPLQDLELLAIFQLVQMVAVARRRKVHVELGARGSVGLHRNAGVVLGKLLKAVINILRNQAALFDPAFLSFIGTHPQETPLLLQHLDAIAVLNRADFVVHGGNAIAQAGLRRRDVHVFVMLELGPAAPR